LRRRLRHRSLQHESLHRVLRCDARARPQADDPSQREAVAPVRHHVLRSSLRADVMGLALHAVVPFETCSFRSRKPPKHTVFLRAPQPGTILSNRRSSSLKHRKFPCVSSWMSKPPFGVLLCAPVSMTAFGVHLQVGKPCSLRNPRDVLCRTSCLSLLRGF